MIIDCHGHYTTAPKELQAFRDEQIKGNDTPAPLKITDDQIRETIQNGQLKMQQERGSDITIFSPRAAGMGHHIGGAKTSEVWTDACNTLIHRVVKLFPKNFIGVAQLPQTPGVSPANCIPELER
jgi:4-oxalmesaconate hydratase